LRSEFYLKDAFCQQIREIKNRSRIVGEKDYSILEQMYYNILQVRSIHYQKQVAT
jgi:hypothetical protein